MCTCTGLSKKGGFKAFAQATGWHTQIMGHRAVSTGSNTMRCQECGPQRRAGTTSRQSSGGQSTTNPAVDELPHPTAPGVTIAPKGKLDGAADRDQARAKGIRTPPPGRGRRRAAREARGCSLLWGRNNPIYTSTLTQATRGEAGGQCYLSLINLAVRSGGRGLLSTREGRPFALSRVAQKHDMRAGTTMDAHSPETDNNNNLRKKETTKVIAVAPM